MSPPVTTAADGTIDITPPKLVSFSVSPQVDVTSPTSRFEFSWNVTDGLSGFRYGFVSLKSPSGGTSNYYFGNNVPLKRSTGTQGIYIGPFVEAGTWSLDNVTLFDNAGNGIEYYATDLQALGQPLFQVMNVDGADVAMPTLAPGGKIETASVSLSAAARGTQGAAELAVVSVHGLDTGSPQVSGLYGADLQFCNTRRAVSTVCFWTGVAYDGRVGVADAILLSLGAPSSYPDVAPGTYKLVHVNLRDTAGNLASYASRTTDFTKYFGANLTITVTP